MTDASAQNVAMDRPAFQGWMRRHVSKLQGRKLQEYSRTAEQTARDELIVGHLWLVRHIIGKLAARMPSGVDVENLESAGVLGLVEAAQRFDSTRGVDFKSFAALADSRRHHR